MRLLLPLLLIAAVSYCGYVVGLSRARAHARRLAEAESLIDKLGVIAWEHRELDPNLSIIITDEITQHRRRELGGG